MKIVISTFLVLFVVVTSAVPQMPRKHSVASLGLDRTKPFVYISFDHLAPRPKVEEGEPQVGMWLRLENNSIFPIEVEVMDTSTEPRLRLVPVEITPQMTRIPRIPRTPRPENVPVKMPSGYGRHGAVEVIAPGRSLAFSVPFNYVARTWYMRVPFGFKHSAGTAGVQPECFAVFTLDGVPPEQRKRFFIQQGLDW